MKKEHFKLFGAVYLILLKEEKVMLLRRYNTGWNDGNYSLIAGHIDGGESMTAALCREAKKEANIEIAPENVSFVHATHRLDSLDGREYIDTFFAVTKWQGEIVNLEPSKCDDLSWFPLSALPENIIPNVNLALAGYKKGKYYSEIGW